MKKWKLGTWQRFDTFVPQEINAAIPRRVLELGDHIGRTITIDGDYWLIVQYDQAGDPERYMVIPHPHKEASQ
jgi:hypothetical protein